VRDRTDGGAASRQPERLDAFHPRGHVKSILDPSFRYTPSFNTDLDKTFARIRRHQRQQEKSAMQTRGEALAKVTSIVRKTIR
ncbi:MAG TPA: hypothetical protein VKT00_05880, partial [Casimicrobiaceae bacterium]|nr:hypothetical protein [Casimicrobiaceae bacterium]